MSGVVEIVDTTTRDGNQSLWSATGLTTADIVAIAPTIDRVGFRAVDFTSSTHMAVAVRFHREDPWERLRLVRAAMPETKLSFITSGMRFITWVPADEDVMRLAFRCVARNGIRRFQVVDPSNDPERLRRVAALARQEGVEEIVLGLTYSISEVHTHAYYAERAAALADCAEMDAFYLKDPGGLLTPDAVRELAPHFLSAAGNRPVELHSHCTIGLAPLVYAEGLRAGFQVLHTAVGPLARGTSNPAVETTLRDLEAEGRSHRLDVEALGVMAEHFRAIGAGARSAGRHPAGVRRDLLPPSAGRRDGLDDAPHARGAAPPGALRGRARGGRPRARRDGLPDHRHAGLAARGDAGRAQRDRRASAGRTSPTRRSATSSVTTASPRRRLRRRWPTASSRCRGSTSCATSSRCSWRARARASAAASPTRSCLLRLTMPAEQVDAMLADRLPHLHARRRDRRGIPS